MRNAILIVIIFIGHNLLAQDISGKWYALIDSAFAFELSVIKGNGLWKGTYNMTSQFQCVINAPIDSVHLKEDSLFIDLGAVFSMKLNRQNIDNFIGECQIGASEPFNFRLDRNIVDFAVINRSVPDKVYTRQDTLKGSITSGRKWWDLDFYHLTVKVNTDNRTLSGSNLIRYRVLKSDSVMQLDLQLPMKIIRVTQDGIPLSIKREGNAYFVSLEKEQELGGIEELIVYFGGMPKVATNPPWQGGFTWSEDSDGDLWIATSCQFEGASLWWPNKDHPYDEVDSMFISINVPKGLTAVSNGRLVETTHEMDTTTTFHWSVKNPINNYGVNINIGDYSHFSEIYQGKKGPLTCDYYVLKKNLDTAKFHFIQVHKMLEAFEYWFGPYPFYEDGYKLVEVPYLGMEHQSSVTYGNNYGNGYLGRDLSHSGWGLKFDYIIIHESGHEWFANNITCNDVADLWIHEGFTTYAEGLFVEYCYGKKAGEEYLIGIRQNIFNQREISGVQNVNDNNINGDIYAKGAAMLHTLRQIFSDDDQWRGTLHGLNEAFYHQTVSSSDIEHYLAQEFHLDLKPFFHQYLRTNQIPTLEYFFTDVKLVYRWINVVPEFNMKVKVYLDGVEKWLHPKIVWTHEFLEVREKELIVDPNFYVAEFQSKSFHKLK